MSPATLLAMAQRACIRNIAGLQDVGDMSYDLMRPMLKKIDNPQQLRSIEVASPHITEHDAELWKAFIARDIPGWQDKIMEPKNPRSWWKVYRKLIREERRVKEESEEQLKAALMGIDKQKEANQAQIVQKVIPQQSQGRQAFAYGVRNQHGNSWGQNRTPALQNAKRGKDILSALRKQSSNAQQQKGLSWTQPAKAMLPGAKSQIRKAPEGMVRDHARPVAVAVGRQQAQASGGPSAPAPRVFVSRHASSAQDKALKDALRSEQAKKEDRLRALASGGSKASPATSQPASQVRSVTASAPSPPVMVQSPSKVMSPASQPRQATALSVLASSTRRLSPSPVPSMVRKRPAASMFMPAKKRII